MYQECRHIMPSGAKCHSPALQDAPYCYFHARLHRLSAAQVAGSEEPLNLPVLEDRSAIQLALSQVLKALGSASLDPRRAGLLIYGLQIASQNVERKVDIDSKAAVRSLALNGDGEELAPERLVCEPPEDCSACARRKKCVHYDPLE